MTKEFTQLQWDSRLDKECRELLQKAQAEDLQTEGDLTTRATLPAEVEGQALFRLRQPGVVAGLACLEIAADVYDPRLRIELHAADGEMQAAGTTLAQICGPVASILAVERPALNLLGRLSGIATQTRDWVKLVANDQCHLYDTRKTTPGLRLLEKYAVRCGGGRNHRSSLSDAILIKDNHLALGGGPAGPLSASDAVERARLFVNRLPETQRDLIIEVEVDTWSQFVDALTAQPDIILLDNMSAEELKRAVEHRNAHAPEVQLEASGGITAATLPGISASGVERISMGALTHSAVQLDIGLDWD